MNDRELAARIEKVKMRLWYWAKENGHGRAGGYELEEIVERGLRGEL